ncbi:MAG TPA: GNAT family N-acetyltransferase [Bacillota bacterium]|jgi:hypothetical protein
MRSNERGDSGGRRLVAAVVGELTAGGFRSMLVWVLADNPFRRFYESLGGTYLRSQKMEIGGARLNEVAYAWTDLQEGDSTSETTRNR